MEYFKWLAAALVGAAVGGAVWIAVGYFGHLEVGWIAWIVGLLAGFGARFAAKETVGAGPGIAAVAAAILVIAFSKYMVIELAIGGALTDAVTNSAAEIPDESLIARIADEVAEEQESQGKPVKWPEDSSLETATAQADYPEEIWKVAQSRWEALSPEEHQRRRDVEQERTREFMETFSVGLKRQLFVGSFSPWDLLWFGLAAFTAFRVGSGLASDD